MKISYDPDVDAMYIKLLDGDHECRTVRLTDEIALDFGKAEALVGVEILDASRILGLGKLPHVVLENIATREAPRRKKAPARVSRAHKIMRKAG